MRETDKSKKMKAKTGGACIKLEGVVRHAEDNYLIYNVNNKEDEQK